MLKDSKNLFFSTEVAASLGLEEAIVFSLISDSLIGVAKKKIGNRIKFYSRKKIE